MKKVHAVIMGIVLLFMAVPAASSGNSVDVYGAADPAEPTTCVLADTIQKYVPAAP